MPMPAPRTRSSAAGGRSRSSRPRKRALPCARPLAASSPITARNSWLLPAPDSPTTPRHSPAATARSSPSTAAPCRRACGTRRRGRSAAAPRRVRRSGFTGIERIAQPSPSTFRHSSSSDQQRRRHEQHPGRRLISCAPTVIRLPRLARGSCTPRPRKLRKLSNRIICGTVSVAYTSTGPEQIRQDVAHEDRERAHPERARRLDELAPLQRERLAAHDARGGEPAHRAERDEQHREAAARQERRQDDDDEQVRQRIQHVDEAHHEPVGAPAGEAGDRPPGDADHQAHHARQHADQRATGAAPCSVRTNRSRPSRSVPSQCAPSVPGGCARCCQSRLS